MDGKVKKKRKELEQKHIAFRTYIRSSHVENIPAQLQADLDTSWGIFFSQDSQWGNFQHKQHRPQLINSV